jgi:hypothetical protein
MILNALVERLKRRAKDDFKGRHFEATLILRAVSWYLRYPLSYRATARVRVCDRPIAGSAAARVASSSMSAAAVC